MPFILAVFLIITLFLTLLMCYQESKQRKIHFLKALLLCILFTPLFGYIIITTQPLRNPNGCRHCENQENEAEYCSVCGKNSFGEQKTHSYTEN